MSDYQLWRNVGSEVVGTAGATAKIDFTAVSGYNANFRRQGVLVTSCGAAECYLKLVTQNAAAPTVTAANYNVPIPAGTGVKIPCTRDLDLYIFGTTVFVAKEIG